MQGESVEQGALGAAPFGAVTAFEVAEGERVSAAVKRVDGKGEAARRKVHADLVRTAGEGLTREQRVTAKTLGDTHEGCAFLTLLLVHLLPTGSAPVGSKGQVDAILLAVPQGVFPFHEREVLLGQTARFERRAQAALGVEVFGDDERTRRVLVQTVDDARPEVEGCCVVGGRGVFPAALDRESKERPRDRGGGFVPTLRLDGEARRFVDDEDIGILPQHRDLQLGCHGPAVGRSVLIELHQDDLVLAQPLGRHDAVAIEQNTALAHLLAQESLRKLGIEQPQELVEFEPGVLDRHDVDVVVPA